MRSRLIESISKDEQQDGMDGILICYDIQSDLKHQDSIRISYAASNNEPVLIRENEAFLLEKDKMPVGKGERMDSFKTHYIDLQKGDVLYLYTDGYADQFGGEKGKKFKYKQLNEFLLSSSTKEMNEQSTLLINEFDKWKGELEQVDDVLVFGCKI